MVIVGVFLVGLLAGGVAGAIVGACCAQSIPEYDPYDGPCPCDALIESDMQVTHLFAQNNRQAFDHVLALESRCQQTRGVPCDRMP